MGRYVDRRAHSSDTEKGALFCQNEAEKNMVVLILSNALHKKSKTCCQAQNISLRNVTTLCGSKAKQRDRLWTDHKLISNQGIL